MIRKRGGWLSALFFGEMLTATAMSFFEDEIAKAVVLALFVPLVISSGGNSGSQAASIIIRALALRGIKVAGLVPRNVRGIDFRLVAGIYAGSDRLYPHRGVATSAPDQLWSALFVTGVYRVGQSDWCGDVWNFGGEYVAVFATAPRLRSRSEFRTVCSDPSGCDRTVHLFFGGAADFARHTVIGGFAAVSAVR